MRIYKEEIFGPVLSVVRAKTFEEAVKLINAAFVCAPFSLMEFIVRTVPFGLYGKYDELDGDAVSFAP